jgi:fucose permease
MTLGSWVTRIPAIQQHLSLRPGTVGLVLLVLAIGALSSMAVSGWLSERIGDVRIIALAVMIIAASLPVIGAAGSVAMLVAGLFMLGAGSGAMDVAMNAEAVRVERGYGRSIVSSFHGMWSTGSMAGAAIGSAVVSIPPFPFLTAMAVAVAIVGLTAVRFIVSPEKKTALTNAAPAEKNPMFVIPPRSLLGLSVVICCAYLSEGSIGDWNALFLVREEHVRAGIAAAGFAAFSMAMAIGRFAGDYVVHRFGPVSTVRYGSLLAALALSAELVIGKPWAVFPSLIILGLSYAAIVPVVFSAAGNTPGMSSSRALAAVATAGYGGFLGGPPAIGFIAEAIHLRGALGLIVLLCLTMTAFSKSVERRTHEVSG